jgi:hypothetical protein
MREDDIFSHVTSLYDLGIKRPGTAQGRAAEEYIIRALESYGYRVRTQEIPVGVFNYDAASISFEGHVLPLFPYIPSSFTPRAGVTAPLVYLEDVAAFAGGDIRGKIVISPIPYGQFSYGLVLKAALGFHDPDGDLPSTVQDVTWNTDAEVRFLAAARDGGAAAVLGIYPALGGGARRPSTDDLAVLVREAVRRGQGLVPFLFNPLSDVVAGMPGPLPAAGAGPAVGTALAAAARLGKTATFTLAGTKAMSTTRNIWADLEGRGGRMLMVASHHDTMWNGAVEDCTGCGIVLSLARIFRSAGAVPVDDIRFAFFAAEQYRDLGVRQYLAAHGKELERRLVADVHVEHVGLEAVMGDSGELTLTGKLQPRAFFTTPGKGFDTVVMEAVRRHDLRRTVVLPTDTPLGVPTDACPFAQAGLPVVSFISAPLYWNASEDTLDKVPRNELPRVRDAVADIMDGLMTSDG